ncbi:hypothetical protein Scep_001974 [Stephania cephalantha]|uniref:Uncharacterized protein n=1 Tax=Stephania cephalantha TaxID=152367 RepID=A0AAP0L964_9MAGN
MKVGYSISPNRLPILLCRCFLKTIKTKLDISKGTMSLEFEDKIYKFKINNKHNYEEYDELFDNKINDKDFLELNYYDNFNAEIYAINAVTMKTVKEVSKKEQVGDTSKEKKVTKNG